MAKSNHFHAVIWLDHREARVFNFNSQEADRLAIYCHETQLHLHRKANSVGDGHATPDSGFFERIGRALERAGAILITGPASAKLELRKYLQDCLPQVASRIAGIETVDHPTDGALVKLARRYFLTVDRLSPQRA